jgi:hypothetical protein
MVKKDKKGKVKQKLFYQLATAHFCTDPNPVSLKCLKCFNNLLKTQFITLKPNEIEPYFILLTLFHKNKMKLDEVFEMELSKVKEYYFATQL